MSLPQTRVKLMCRAGHLQTVQVPGVTHLRILTASVEAMAKAMGLPEKTG